METAQRTRRPIEESVVREFPTLGKYRVRLVRKGERTPQLDIREYVTGEKFTGFTRRGIRLSGRPEWEQLVVVLKEALDVAQGS